MTRPLLLPKQTLAIVLGAHDWSAAGLESSDAFRNSAGDVARYLRGSPGLGLPAVDVLNLFDSAASANDQVRRIAEFITRRIDAAKAADRPIRDLIVYYVGHGAFAVPGNDYLLLVRETARDLEFATGLYVKTLANCIEQRAPFLRRFVILDCCFAAEAANSFGAGGGAKIRFQSAGEAQMAVRQVADALPGRGTLVLCSSDSRSPSRYADDATHTLFSGAFLAVLTDGLEGGSHGEALSFRDIQGATWERMRERHGVLAARPVLHVPDQSDGDLSIAPAFPNPAVSARGGSPAPGPTEPDAAGPQSRELRPFAALETAWRPRVENKALLMGIAAGALVAAVVGAYLLWPPHKASQLQAVQPAAPAPATSTSPTATTPSGLQKGAAVSPKSTGAAATQGANGTGAAPPADPYTIPAARQLGDGSYVVYFGYDQYILTLQAQRELSRVADDIMARPTKRVVIVGHTDTAGSAKFNIGMSERMAKSVADALVSQGVSQNLLSVDWKGETDLAVQTADGVDEIRNRRVTIQIVR